MKIPIQIGAHSFPTKSAAKDYARFILDSSSDGEIIDNQDGLFLRNLVAIHPESSQKTGCGIDHFTAATDPIWKTTRHFVIVRTDGSSTDFSFHTCIDGANDRKDVLSALRFAVSDQIINFQRCSFAVNKLIYCPYTDQLLAPIFCHVDHTPPDTFMSLVSRWMTQEKLEFSDLPLVDNADNQWVRELKDSEQSSSWQRFHITNCNLRLISPVANLSHVKKEARMT